MIPISSSLDTAGMHSWIPCNCWEIINIKAPILKSITILKKSKGLLNQAWSMRRWPMSCGVEVKDVYIQSPTTIEMQIMFKREAPQATKISYLNQNDDKYNTNVSISCELMVFLSLHSGSIHPCFHRVLNQYWQSYQYYNRSFTIIRWKDDAVVFISGFHTSPQFHRLC